MLYSFMFIIPSNFNTFMFWPNHYIDFILGRRFNSTLFFIFKTLRSCLYIFSSFVGNPVLIKSKLFQAVDLSGSYSGRRRRSDNNLYGLVPEVDLDAVKIKPHGKNGQQVQNSASGIPVGRAIFEPSFSRVKRDDFIPFNEYDQRRVKTLKIEQNDFLALPKRLEQEEEQTDRQKRKFQVEEQFKKKLNLKL